MPTPFSQHDPRWANDTLGDPAEYPRPYTLAQAGCLVTAAASMLADFGTPTDPHRLNLWLRDHNGYKDGCLLRFAALAGLGADLMELIRPPAAPLSGTVLDALDAGHAVIAELLRDAITTHTMPQQLRHWVRLCAGVLDRGFTWYIVDPWQLPGAELTTMRRAYPRAKLRSIAVYAPSDARCEAPRPGLAAERAGRAGNPALTSPWAAHPGAGSTQDPQGLPPGPSQQVIRTPPQAMSHPLTINRDAIAAARKALQGRTQGGN
jgi:hypothetical protein